MSSPDEIAAPRIVDELLAKAEASRASDIHLQSNSTGAEVAFRLDSVLTPITTFDSTLAERVFGRIKYLAKLRTYQDSMPQDGRIDRAEVGTKSDIRVSTYPTVAGEKIVLRLFSQEHAKTFAELGFPEESTSIIESVLRKPSGLILITGPAGSGKTSTIYAALRYLVELGGRHIITIEDPAEQIIPGVMQTEINEARGLGFATAARHLLRQDPQVLVIGEVRDEETAKICVRAASTGHLVICTLHAGSCKGVLERLLLLCPDAFSIASSLSLILNQRLVRRTCEACSGSGCDRCLKTGFHGQIPILECIIGTEETNRSLREQRVEALNPAESLREALNQLIRLGLTRESEMARVLGL